MGAAVENVHHGNGQHLGIDAADVTVQGDAQGIRCRMGHRHGYGQNRVGAQTGLVGGAVQLDHGLVDLGLVQSVETHNGFGDFGVDIGDGLHDRLAAVFIAAVPELAGFINAGGSAGGNCGTPNGTVLQINLGFYRGIAPGIENLTGNDINDFKILFHGNAPPK